MYIITLHTILQIYYKYYKKYITNMTYYTKSHSHTYIYISYSI